MIHDDIKQFLSPEYPKESRSESSQGLQYRYMIDSDVLALDTFNLPRVGDLWDLGLDSTDVQFTPKIGGSRFDLLEVSTVRSVSSSGSTIGTNRKAKLVEERYQLRWLPNSLPLLKHPSFVGIDAQNRADIIGWENELNEEVKANFGYSPRDSEGNVTSAVVITLDPGTYAYEYVRLRMLGHENYNFFAPNWSIIGEYEGEETPGVGSIGQKVDAGDIPGLPQDLIAAEWEWVKTDDSPERQGKAPRWTRTQTWTGARKVDYDVDQIFDDAGNPVIPGP